MSEALSVAKVASLLKSISEMPGAEDQQGPRQGLLRAVRMFLTATGANAEAKAALQRLFSRSYGRAGLWIRRDTKTEADGRVGYKLQRRELEAMLALEPKSIESMSRSKYCDAFDKIQGAAGELYKELTAPLPTAGAAAPGCGAPTASPGSAAARYAGPGAAAPATDTATGALHHAAEEVAVAPEALVVTSDRLAAAPEALAEAATAKNPAVAAERSMPQVNAPCDAPPAELVSPDEGSASASGDQRMTHPHLSSTAPAPSGKDVEGPFPDVPDFSCVAALPSPADASASHDRHGDDQPAALADLDPTAQLQLGGEMPPTAACNCRLASASPSLWAATYDAEFRYPTGRASIDLNPPVPSEPSWQPDKTPEWDGPEGDALTLKRQRSASGAAAGALSHPEGTRQDAPRNSGPKSGLSLEERRGGRGGDGGRGVAPVARAAGGLGSGLGHVARTGPGEGKVQKPGGSGRPPGGLLRALSNDYE